MNMIKTDIIVGASTFSPGGRLYVTRYQTNGGWSLVVVSDDQERAMNGPEYKATVNLSGDSDPRLGEHEIWLKGWTENDGVPEALVAAGAVELIDHLSPCGFATAQKARFTKRLIEQIRKAEG